MRPRSNGWRCLRPAPAALVALVAGALVLAACSGGGPGIASGGASGSDTSGSGAASTAPASAPAPTDMSSPSDLPTATSSDGVPSSSIGPSSSSVGQSPTATTPPPRPNATPVYGMVSGQVVAGPTCPVEKIPPDPSCALRPVPGAILVVTDASGREVLRITASSTGAFSFRLVAGRYTLVPQPVAGLMHTAPQTPIAIPPTGGMQTLQITYDTGIR